MRESKRRPHFWDLLEVPFFGPLKRKIKGLQFLGLFGGPIFWTLERDFFPRQSASQAMGFWGWLNYANEDATNPLLLNMDETSVALRPRAEHGTVATRLKKPGSRAIDAASLQEMRTRFTLMCTICGDTRIQPFLPQVLLTNGRVFGRKPTIPHSIFFLCCRIALDSCGQIVARSQKEIKNQLTYGKQQETTQPTQTNQGKGELK